MKPKTAPASAITRMVCDRCDTQVLIISPPDNPYPVKLPGHCPCCLAQITEYRPFDGDVMERGE